MSLPALAPVEDLEVRLGKSCDRPRAQAALDDASALIRAEAGQTWVDADGNLDGVPDIIVTLAMKVARRAVLNPDGHTSESVGPFSVSMAPGDVYLLDSEKRIIRQTVGQFGTIGVLSTTRGTIETGALLGEPEYVDTDTEW